MSKNKYPAYSLRLEPVYMAKLVKEAKARNLPLSELIRKCLRAQIPE